MSNDPRDGERFPEPPSDEEIAERLRKVRDELSAMELPDLPDEEIEAREQAIRSRIGKSADLPEVPDWTAPNRPNILKPPDKREVSAGVGLGVGMSIAYTIITVPLIGLAVGWLIDKATGGNLGRALGTMIGLGLGLYMALRIVAKNENRL